MRKATAFRGGANKTAPPCETETATTYLVTVPVEQLQREMLLGKPSAFGSAESLRCLPVCCSPVGALSELLMNLS